MQQLLLLNKGVWWDLGGARKYESCLRSFMGKTQVIPHAAFISCVGYLLSSLLSLGMGTKKAELKVGKMCHRLLSLAYSSTLLSIEKKTLCFARWGQWELRSWTFRKMWGSIPSSPSLPPFPSETALACVCWQQSALGSLLLPAAVPTPFWGAMWQAIAGQAVQWALPVCQLCELSAFPPSYCCRSDGRFIGIGLVPNPLCSAEMLEEECVQFGMWCSYRVMCSVLITPHRWGVELLREISLVCISSALSVMAILSVGRIPWSNDQPHLTLRTDLLDLHGRVESQKSLVFLYCRGLGADKIPVCLLQDIMLRTVVYGLQPASKAWINLGCWFRKKWIIFFLKKKVWERGNTFQLGGSWEDTAHLGT